MKKSINKIKGRGSKKCHMNGEKSKLDKSFY